MKHKAWEIFNQKKKVFDTWQLPKVSELPKEAIFGEDDFCYQKGCEFRAAVVVKLGNLLIKSQSGGKGSFVATVCYLDVMLTVEKIREILDSQSRQRVLIARVNTHAKKVEAFSEYEKQVWNMPSIDHSLRTRLHTLYDDCVSLIQSHLRARLLLQEDHDSYLPILSQARLGSYLKALLNMTHDGQSKKISGIKQLLQNCCVTSSPAEYLNY